MKHLYDKISLKIYNFMVIYLIKFVHIGKKMAESKSTWLVVTTNLLIMQFESYEILYNMKQKDYKSRKKESEVYNNISEAIKTIHEGSTAIDIKKKFNHYEAIIYLKK
jgi:hypothetical protein